jgi:hypothetical protein
VKNSTVTRGWVEFVDEDREPVRVVIGFAEQAKAERTLGSKKVETVTGLMFMTKLALIKTGELPADTSDAEFEDIVAGIAVDGDDEESGEPAAPSA